MDLKINKKEMLKARAGISYFEIFTLVLATFSLCWMISVTESKVVSAAPAPPTAPMMNCCPLDKKGAPCNDFLYSECSDKCSTSCLPTSCEETSNCKLGCCIDPKEGTCVAKTAKVKCEQDGGVWKDDENCNVNVLPECKRGCCVLGSEADFTTPAECERASKAAGLRTDFRAGIDNQVDCFVLGGEEDYGACLLEGGGCKMLTNSKCISTTGKNVILGKLCTAVALNTTCKKTENTMCSGEDVYYQDSCGNPANIYDSEKYSNNDYWEKVFASEQICGASDANGNRGSATCGNCNSLLGSKCNNYIQAGEDKPVKGDYICQDLSCKNAPGQAGIKQDRRNGESWCVYEGQIGDGKDIVGSRHYKYTCLDGEVVVEGCDDYRNSICIEADFNMGNGVKMSNSACIVNNWVECIEANSDLEKIEDCSLKQQCLVKQIRMDKFAFDVCVPKYPAGFSIDDPQVSKQICGAATRTCTVIFKNKRKKCICDKQCECLEESFVRKMNEVCTSLGDCGAEVNTAGVLTENYKVGGKAKVRYLSEESKKILKSYAKPLAGQRAQIENITEYLIAVGILSSDAAANPEKASKTLSQAGYGAMGMGAVAYGVGALMGGGQVMFAGQLATMNPQLATLGNVFVGAAIGFMVGSMIAKMINADKTFTMAIAITSAVLGAIIGYSLMAETATLCVVPPVCVILVIILIILVILGWGKKCKPKIVTFTCKPWQPPIGGNDCNKCNSKDFPCTEYKCRSLGSACQFINEGTTHEMCIAAIDDGKYPKISPLNVFPENYTITEKENGFELKDRNGECIKAFSPLILGVKTDEAAYCKIDKIHTTSFDQMADDFGTNANVLEHVLGLSAPSAQSILAADSEVDPDLDVEASEVEETVLPEYVLDKGGKMRFYVRCRDIFGNFNPAEYLIETCIEPGPDTTPAYIVQSEPADNSFMPVGTASTEAKFYMNEPAECKWSTNDKNYSSMENTMSCETGLESVSIYGWVCNTTIPGLQKGANKIFISCLDQPWLPPQNQSQRNTNTEGYPYTLTVTENPLVIDEINPNGTMRFGSEPITIELDVKTSGGVDNGKAECQYGFGESYSQFKQTFSSSHKNIFNQMTRGNWNINIRCEDDAGNKATGMARFKLELDNSAPKITRVYYSGSELYLNTDESSECAYSNTGCNFRFENGTQMLGGFSGEHSANWDVSRPYYIKCRDSYNNEPISCNIKIKAYNLGR